MPRPGFLVPKVSHTVLALVLIPIVVEILLMWPLWALVERTEKIAVDERKRSDVIESMNMLMIHLANTTGTVANRLITGTNDTGSNERNSQQALNAEFDRIAQNTKDDPIQDGFLQKIRSMTNDELNYLRSLPPTTNFAETIQRVHRLSPLIRQVGQSHDQVLKMIDQQKSELAKSKAEEEKSRNTLKDIILISLVGNILMLFFWGLFFIRSFTTRLQTLVNNAQQLPKGMPLSKTVSGVDELAYLDSVLHDAAEDLRRAADHRKSLMEMVAHDLRAPLMSCQVSLEILSSEKFQDLPDMAKRNIDATKRNITRSVDLVNDLLTIEKLEAGKLEITPAPASISKLVEDSMQSVSALAKMKEIEIVNQCEDAEVVMDKVRIMQVLNNYLSNAIKFSPQKSSIEISSKTDGERLAISVRDHGPGLQQEDKHRLFEKFYQTEEGKGRSGFGLGLAICRLIVESHGGKVGVETEPGKGCRFWFTLPVKGNPA